MLVRPGVKVHIAVGVTDMRKGLDCLAMLVQGLLHQDPFSGHLFTFRGRKANLIKIVYWDGSGLCLFTKQLDAGRFPWPGADEQGDTLALTSEQLSALIGGIDYRAPERVWRPAGAGWTRSAFRKKRYGISKVAWSRWHERLESLVRLDLENLPRDVDLLHRLVRDMAAIVEARDDEIGRLQRLVKQLQRAQFGRRSERLDSDQLALGLEDIDADIARARHLTSPNNEPEPDDVAVPRRAPLTEYLPRTDILLDCESDACLDCGGRLLPIGETTSEMLDWVPAQLRVVRFRRPRYGCRACGSILQVPAPERPIAKGLATSGLIAALYAVEARIRGCSADEHRRVRQADSRQRVEAMKPWLDPVLRRVPNRSGLADAIRYALAHWVKLSRFIDDGRIDLDNNPVERAIPPVALGRKNHLFAGSHGGAERWATVTPLITSTRLNDVEPYAYLKDVLERMSDCYPASQLDQLLPWNWKAADPRI